MNKTKIEYIDMTWNPIAMRCTPVSSGCDNCWHLRMANRMAGFFSEKSMHGTDDDSKIAFEKSEAYDGCKIYLNTAELSAPLRRRKPTRIGVQLMGDLFHESITFEWIAAIYGVMAAAPQHQFFVLTKRPERRVEFFEWVDVQAPKSAPSDKWEPWWRCYECVLCYHDLAPLNRVDLSGLSGSTWPIPNVLEGTSVEDQPSADERIPILLKTPAEKRWVSYEPALEKVDFGLIGRAPRDIYPSFSLVHEHIDLIVAGAETGPGARPAELDWFRSARNQCALSSVPFFFKRDSSGSRLLDGRMHVELP